MLPDIDAEDRGLVRIHDRVVLVRGAGDFQLAILAGDDPGPAGAEAASAGLVDRVLERVQAAEALDGVLEGTARGGFVTSHNQPEHGVVQMTAAVVANRGALVF